MKKCNVIFDFDGTLVDSFDTVIAKLNLLAEEFHFRKIQSDEIEELKYLTSQELIRFFGIPFYKLPFVIYRAREYMRHEISVLSTFEHLPELLTELNDAGAFLGILTSNSAENVEAWLERYHIRHLFHFIHAESSYFGKKRVLKKMIKSYQMDPSQTFYIGDETRDIEAAKACHIHSIAVTWGFNSEAILASHNPDYIARKPEDIAGIIRENQDFFVVPSTKSSCAVS